MKAMVLEAADEVVPKGVRRPEVEAGGQIVVEEQEVPGKGAFCLFADPEGRVLGVWKEAALEDEEE